MTRCNSILLEPRASSRVPQMNGILLDASDEKKPGGDCQQECMVCTEPERDKQGSPQLRGQREATWGPGRSSEEARMMKRERETSSHLLDSGCMYLCEGAGHLGPTLLFSFYSLEAGSLISIKSPSSSCHHHQIIGATGLHGVKTGTF